MAPARIAVIGAGIAGLTCARRLAAGGCAVRVFDKGRAPGGRMSTRRCEPFRFDHGAQYFTVREGRFADAVAAWQEVGVVAPWRARFAAAAGGVTTPLTPDGARYVGEPGMSGIGGHLAVGLTVELRREVVAVMRRNGRWRLVFAGGGDAVGFDIVIVTTPAPQAIPLLTAAPALASAAARARLLPCWAVMLAFDEPVPTLFDAIHGAGGTLAWAARDGSKPGRPPAETWVLHADADWTAAHLEDDPDSVAAALSSALEALIDGRLPPPLMAIGHRWRHALVAQPVGAPCLFEADRGLGAAGDWCLGGRIEAAFLSGLAIADEVLRSNATAGAAAS
ncbi:MAG: NAD(P)-binding protein [Rhodospirillales bacterium]|jgi:hypothetical protein|nr:NAD(P)-binding protein [Rhodospirillales bacterium]